MLQIIRKFLLFFFVCCFPILSYCCDKPQELAVNSVKHLLEKNYDKIIENVYLPDSIIGNKDLTDKFKEEKIEFLKMKREDDVDFMRISENGGMDEIIVEKNENNEEIHYLNEERTEARIKVTIICKNGYKQTSGVKLILQNGKWKLYIG